MSEPRFRLDYEEDDAIFIVENDDIVYPIRNDTIKEFELQKLVDKLNEQQATITKLKELNDDKGKRIISLIRTNKTLKEENEQLRKELKELENNYKDLLYDGGFDE